MIIGSPEGNGCESAKLLGVGALVEAYMDLTGNVRVGGGTKWRLEV